MTTPPDHAVGPVASLRRPHRAGAAAATAAPHALQQPLWPDATELARARGRLEQLPPLVGPAGVARLRRAMGAAAAGQAVVLQGGDCAEAFGTSDASVRGSLALLADLARAVEDAVDVPVLRVGRMAGQYAKPRSSPVERVGDRLLPSFRGHIVHSHAPHAAARRPDPRRLLHAYDDAARILRTVRATAAAEPASGGTRGVWVSHEALLLDYEEALVRRDPHSGGEYAASGHLLWLGDRTRRPDGPHARLLARVSNPVACKVGPGAEVEEVLALCARLDPGRVPGRLTLIPRLGAAHVGTLLPPLVRAVRRAGHPVVWACDPMHGNTVVTADGRKTRHVTAVADEAAAFVGVLAAEGLTPGGLHLELTGDDVVECVAAPGQDPPAGRSTSLCDPRLNAEQSRVVVHRFAAALRRVRRRAA